MRRHVKKKKKIPFAIHLHVKCKRTHKKSFICQSTTNTSTYSCFKQFPSGFKQYLPGTVKFLILIQCETLQQLWLWLCLMVWWNKKWQYKHSSGFGIKRNDGYNDDLIPTAKYGKGSVILWSCFSFKGFGILVWVHGMMDSIKQTKKKKTGHFKSNFGFLCLETKTNLSFDNDLTHMSKSTQKWLTNHRRKFPPWPSQFLDLNLIKWPLECAREGLGLRMIWTDCVQKNDLRCPALPVFFNLIKCNRTIGSCFIDEDVV